MPGTLCYGLLLGVLLQPQPPNLLRAVSPAPLPQPPTTAAVGGTPLKPRRSESASPPHSSAENSVEGEYLVQSPNVFRGVSAAGAALETPKILSREEQHQVSPVPASGRTLSLAPASLPPPARRVPSSAADLRSLPTRSSSSRRGSTWRATTLAASLRAGCTPTA